MNSSNNIASSIARHRLCEENLLSAGEMKKFELEGMDPVVLCNHEGTLYALNDDCTHAIASLSEGRLEDGLLICPVHGGSFDVTTGAPTKLPCRRPLKTWLVEVSEGFVWLKTGE